MTVEANAKVNFTLEVFGVRADGYHALRSVVMPISLSDTLELEVTDDGAITSDTGYDDDLCVKAARVLRSSVSPSSSAGAVIRVTKRIPAGGGLGGGSADAAAVLVALNGLWGTGLSRAELADIGAQVGSDVPSLVLGGGVIMEGRGEKVTPLATLVPQPPVLHLVLVNPGAPCSTRDVYAACVPRATDGVSATGVMVDALRSGDLRAISLALMNDLREAACGFSPAISDALVSLRSAGALGAMMSGSGSCAFGLVESEAEAVRISSELNFRGLQAWPVRTLC